MDAISVPKDGVIDIYEKKGESGKYEATLTICSVSANGRSSEIFYTGKVLYSDMLIRFSFVNQYNPLEEDLLYIFNPLELRDFTTGLLCGISSAGSDALRIQMCDHFKTTGAYRSVPSPAAFYKKRSEALGTAEYVTDR